MTSLPFQAEEVKEIITQEVVQKCGKAFSQFCDFVWTVTERLVLSIDGTPVFCFFFCFFS